MVNSNISDRLKNRNLNETVAVVDMGGGSTQVAFVPVDLATIQGAPPEDVHSIQLLGNPAKFYIRRYFKIFTPSPLLVHLNLLTRLYFYLVI